MILHVLSESILAKNKINIKNTLVHIFLEALEALDCLLLLPSLNQFKIKIIWPLRKTLFFVSSQSSCVTI